ncbi:hypothetical protein EE612_005037, partial [Oryza sativa]
AGNEPPSPPHEPTPPRLSRRGPPLRLPPQIANRKTLIWHLRRQNTKGKDPGFATGWGGSGVTQIPQSTEKPLRKLTLEDTRPFGCTSTDFARTEKSEESNGTRSSNSFGSQARGSGAARGGYPPPL